jgi:xylan 1,4-beta-xylosidase
MGEKMEINALAAGKPLVHYWKKCVGAGRANEGLRANWLEQLKLVVAECGFEYIRFHGLFHDDMFVCRIGGKIVYNWQYVDELFDRLLDVGIRPFVEFGFCPIDLASTDRTIFWWKGNISPPTDYTEWSDLITKSLQHWIGRYGLNEVRKWYFEVWNEPNLVSMFWNGTRSQYFELYKVTALALKTVDPLLRVGGPATSSFVPDDRFDSEVEDTTRHLTFKSEAIDEAEWRPVWLEQFLEYCAGEKLPVDFVSFHPYPTDFALDLDGITKSFSRKVEATYEDLIKTRRIMAASPFPEAEVHLTEWSSSPSPRDMSHDYLPAATYVVKTNLAATELVDSLSYWTFTDVFEETGGGNSIFHGGFGLINFQAISKPTFHAYRFLNMLGDLEIGRDDGWTATRHSKDGSLSLLFYHYPPEAKITPPVVRERADAEKFQAIGQPKFLQGRLTGLKPLTGFIVETLDQENGFAIKTWNELGRPEPPDRAQTRQLRQAGLATRKERLVADENGNLELRLNLLPWSIVSVREE